MHQNSKCQEGQNEEENGKDLGNCEKIQLEEMLISNTQE